MGLSVADDDDDSPIPSPRSTTPHGTIGAASVWTTTTQQQQQCNGLSHPGPDELVLFRQDTRHQEQEEIMREPLELRVSRDHVQHSAGRSLIAPAAFGLDTRVSDNLQLSLFFDFYRVDH